MDKIGLLKARKDALMSSGEKIRARIAALTDEKSFVELDAFSFSRNEFYGEDVPGEGVVCGLAAINEFAVAVVAINPDVLSGGLTNAGCKKIVKCLDKALKSEIPVIYLLSSKGVAVGEGVAALEGVAEVLAKMTELKGIVPQFSVSEGDVFGSAALFVSACDYNFFYKGACVSYVSPLVACAKLGVSPDKEKVGGIASASANSLCSFAVSDMTEVRNTVCDILDILPEFGGALLETGDDLNRSAPALTAFASASALIEAVFDKDYFIELNKDYAAEVKTGIGRIGGYSAGAVIFDGKDGVTLDCKNISKIKDFCYYCADNSLPVITFVNVAGISAGSDVTFSTMLKDISALVYAYKCDTPKINVITGNAIGIGYTLFGSKALGADHAIAFADALVSVVNSEEGAEIEFAAQGGDKALIKDRFVADGMDAMNAAKSGFIDNVIEPCFVRAYLISVLQTLV